MSELLKVNNLPTIIGAIFIIAAVEGILSTLESDTLAGKIAIRFLWISVSLATVILLMYYLQRKSVQSL